MDQSELIKNKIEKLSNKYINLTDYFEFDNDEKTKDLMIIELIEIIESLVQENEEVRSWSRY